MGSKRRVRRESRWGTNRILWEAPGVGFDNTGLVTARLMGVVAGEFWFIFAFAFAPPAERLRLSMDRERDGEEEGAVASVGVGGGLWLFCVAVGGLGLVLLLFAPRRLCPVALGDRACEESTLMSGNGGLLFNAGLVAPALLST